MGRLGVRYDPRCLAEEPGPGASAPAVACYEAILRHAVWAERAGVDVLWVAERPFAPGALLPAAFPLGAALAARTKHVRIATGVIPLPLHHPLRVAEDAASLDVISGGRLELGVGLGDHPQGFDGFGIPVGERSGRLEEALALLAQAWSEAPISFAGRHYRIEGVSVHPKPVQRPHPPLWIAAGAEAAVQRVARHSDADGLAAGLLTDSLDAARRFLALRPRDAPPARIAWHLDPRGDDLASVLPTFQQGLPALSGARVDLVVPAPAAMARGSEEREGRRLARLAEAFRSSFATGQGGDPFRPERV